MTIIEELSKIGIVPVIALDDVKDAVPLAKALIDGGLACAEITFRTDAAEESIKRITSQYPEMIVGAGTVLTTEQADRAVNAGASFIVSPGLNPKVVSYCVSKNIPVIPGCANPSDIEAAIELGLKTVKFFPAEAAGGIKMIKAMSAPYSQVKFMPTGGITADNLNEYLSFNKIICCGGSWMVSKEMISAGQFDKITELTKEAVDKMLGFSLAHIGINESDEGNADKSADKFNKLFGFTKNTGSSSIFAGKGIEIMKTPYLGKNGHIAIGTNFIDRAVYHLSKQGFEFDFNTEKRDAKGNLKAIYIKDEISGFAVHLMQR